MAIDHRARGFAQGLIIEAIECSYQMGFVESLWRATSNPANGATKIMKSFGKRAARHWFKHARAQDLADVKIYDSVRKMLAYNFTHYMSALLEGVAKNGRAAPVALAQLPPLQRVEMVWG